MQRFKESGERFVIIVMAALEADDPSLPRVGRRAQRHQSIEMVKGVAMIWSRSTVPDMQNK